MAWFFAVLALQLTACVPNQAQIATNNYAANYTTNSLAKDWREQVRKNPNNPYETSGYPVDNDSEYYYPKKTGTKNGKNNNSQKPKPSSNQKDNTPIFYDTEDSSYGKFPRYNPDDDNIYLDPKQYPLYLD